MKDKYFAPPADAGKLQELGEGQESGGAVQWSPSSLPAGSAAQKKPGLGGWGEDGCILGGLWSFLSDPWDSQEGAAAGPLLLGLHVVSDLEAGLIGLPPGSVFQLP